MSERVQIELLLPYEIDAALAARSVVYLPLGSIEFHSAHLPVGLDGLTAHGVCTRAATATGGLVLPTLYYGIGGGHTAYPWTIMAASGTPLTELLEQALTRLRDFGVQLAVLFTGHFAPEQLELLDATAARWNATHDDLHVLALAINRSDARVDPDHAGIFETSVLAALWPDRVQLDRLPDLVGAPSVDPGGDVHGAQRHDPSHPLHGVFGPDPRTFDPDLAPAVLADVVRWTSAQVDRFIAARS